MASAAPPPYEDVRRKLHELGYLDGRIGRFVLRDAPGGATRAAAKAALLGGPIVGGLMAWVVAAANRPLLRAVDALVLWLYCALVALVALFVLDLCAAGLASGLARRRGVRSGDALRASLIVVLPTLGYIVLLWLRRPEGRTASGDVAFLVAAGGAALLLAWLGGLVSLAGIIGRTGMVPDRARRSLAGVVAAVVILAASGAIVRAVAARGYGSGSPPSAFVAAPAAGRVLVLGIDGLDGDLLQALEPEGAVEDLLRRFGSGAVFPLRRDADQEPPQVWTTIATGVPAGVHGIRGAGAERLPGVATPLRREVPLPLGAALSLLLPTRTVPASGVSRRVLALWEIAALQESSACVGWWASWPARDAETRSSYVVTDRALPKLLAGRGNDDDVAPASLYARLEGSFPGDRADLHARYAARFAALRDEEGARLAWESFLIDAWHLETARLVLQDPAVRAAFVYLPGLDILRHRLPAASAGSPRSFDGQRALSSYVRWLGEECADLPETGAAASIVVADPGRAARADSEGLVSIVGAGVRAGCVGPALSDLDVAPLILDRLGFPASAEMPGRAPNACLASAASPRPRIATFGRKAVPPRPPPGADDPELLERLRTLGYIR